MSHDPVRHIIVHTDSSKPLLHPIEIVWAFIPVNQTGLFKNVFPVAWKITKFSANDRTQFAITWEPSYGFNVAQTSDHERSTAGVSTPIEPGHSVTLSGDDNDPWYWSAPDCWSSSKMMVAVNGTRTAQDIALGIVTKSSPLVVEPVLLHQQVPPGHSLTASPPLRLHAFINRSHHKNAILDAQVQEAPLLGPEGVDVTTLAPITFYRIYTSPETGGPMILKEAIA